MLKRTIFTASKDARMTFTATAPATGSTPSGQADNGSIGTVEGYALVWNVTSSDRGGYSVLLTPNSAQFTNVVHALFNHKFDGGPLGDTSTGSLRLAPDSYGVKASIDLPNTSNGRDVAELVRTGRVGGMSFSMVGDVQGKMSDVDGSPVYTATSYSVDEVTITPIPAFDETTIAPAPTESDAIDDLVQNMSKSKKEHNKLFRKLQNIRLSFLSI